MVQARFFGPVAALCMKDVFDVTHIGYEVVVNWLVSQRSDDVMSIASEGKIVRQ